MLSHLKWHIASVTLLKRRNLSTNILKAQPFPIKSQCQFWIDHFMYIFIAFASYISNSSLFFMFSSLEIELQRYRWKIYCISWERSFSGVLHNLTQWLFGFEHQGGNGRMEINKLLSSKYWRRKIFRLVNNKSNDDESTTYFESISLTHFSEEKKNSK